MGSFGGFGQRVFPGQKSPRTLIHPTRKSSKSDEGADLRISIACALEDFNI
jgi:hypothetical protein